MDSKRSDNIAVKETLPSQGVLEVSTYSCQLGTWHDDQLCKRNTQLNKSLGNLVEKRSYDIKSASEVNKLKVENFALNSNPIKFVTTNILTSGDSIRCKIQEMNKYQRFQKN